MKTNEVNKEISYETLLVTFGEGIGRLDTMFDDPQVWGVATLKDVYKRQGIPYGDMCRLTTEDLEVAEDGEVWIKTARKKTKIDYEAVSYTHLYCGYRRGGGYHQYWGHLPFGGSSWHGCCAVDA